MDSFEEWCLSDKTTYNRITTDTYLASSVKLMECISEQLLDGKVLRENNDICRMFSQAAIVVEIKKTLSNI